jgi:hypothetical protein
MKITANTLLRKNAYFLTEKKEERLDNTKKWDKYRKEIKNKYAFDIGDFKQKLTGGKADKSIITDFKLSQIIKGISIELEHTKKPIRALEIVMDHLKENENYYKYLDTMEKKMEKDKESK